MYPILFEFKGITFTSFGLMLGLAFLSAGWVTSLECERMGYRKDAAWSLIMGAIIGGIVGAKLYYAFLNWPLLVRYPLETLFSRAGLVWYGGFIGGSLGVIVMAGREKLPVPRVADMAALGVPLAYAVGRVGCFLVGDDYGRPTDSWIGIAFPKGSPPSTAGNLRTYFGVQVPESVADWEVLRVHPTQLYEITISLAIFALLWRLRRHPYKAGWLFMAYLALGGLERVFVEVFRAKDDRFFGPLTLAQVISFVLIVGGAYCAWALSRQRREGQTPPAAG
ncbi:MAG: prolipoprotein diacylglyceryl transferase [Gemmatimonadota bacterium]|nr:MAG: prolipoprotein diacylglyceryl transferase [Gemmatimonadota bacterium]